MLLLRFVLLVARLMLAELALFGLFLCSLVLSWVFWLPTVAYCYALVKVGFGIVGGAKKLGAELEPNQQELLGLVVKRGAVLAFSTGFGIGAFTSEFDKNFQLGGQLLFGFLACGSVCAVLLWKFVEVGAAERNGGHQGL